MAGMIRLACKRLTLGEHLLQARWVPHHTPGPLLTEGTLTLRASFPKASAMGEYPCPDPKQPSANTGCQMLNKCLLVLASQAEDTFCPRSQSSPQVPTAGNLLNNTLFINLPPFPVSFPCFSTSVF